MAGATAFSGRRYGNACRSCGGSGYYGYSSTRLSKNFPSGYKSTNYGVCSRCLIVTANPQLRRIHNNV